MIEPKKPGDEEFRLAALRALPLLDTPHEPDFDAIVQLGQALFGTESCVITLIDAERQWFKACVGFDDIEGPRATSFCGHAILESDVFVIPDSHLDDRFHDNPAVIAAPFVRFYAGAQILLPSGYTIGTVCIFDPRPRHDFDIEQRAKLRQLAKLALTAISMRALREDLDRSRVQAERYEVALQAAAGPVALLDEAGRLIFFNEAFAGLCPAWPNTGDAMTNALGLSDSAWSAESMQGQEMMLPLGGQESIPGAVTALVINRDAGGFLVTPVQGA